MKNAYDKCCDGLAIIKGAVGPLYEQCKNRRRKQKIARLISTFQLDLYKWIKTEGENE